MNCPKCNKDSLEVIDSRSNSIYNAPAIYRRRKCLECGYRFTTYEVDVKIIRRWNDD